ncbi:hypothetical protein J6590_091283 [Homalodisca vitripennis]|nr:hypothetical protein J6590_091283 [Homalodisca vitripennis]
MEKDEVWMDENRKRSRKRVETTRGVSHSAVVVTVQQSRGAVLRGACQLLGGDGSAVARRGDDEARADCLYTYSNNAWCLRGGGTELCKIETVIARLSYVVHIVCVRHVTKDHVA